MKIVNCELKINKSFTLIELLIIIGIMMIFTTLSLSIIVSLRGQRQVKVVAEQVKTRIMEAHSFAVTPRSDAASGLTSIRVQITNGSPATLDIQEVTPTTITSILPTKDTLPSNISFLIPPSTTPSDITIDFSTVTTDNVIGQISSGLEVIFTIQSTAKSYQMTVNGITGNVEIK